MRKVTFGMFAAILLLCGSCADKDQRQVKYSVSGSVSAGETVYVVDMLTGDRIDSVRAEDGSFALSGEQERDALLAVLRSGGSWQMLFFNDGTPVEVNLNDTTLKGSELNERLTACDLAIGAAMEPMHRLSDEYEAMSDEERAARGDEINDRAMAAIDQAAKAYQKVVDENRDNFIPAAFLEGLLAYGDMDQMEEALDTTRFYMQHPMAKKLKKSYDEFMASQRQEQQEKDKLVGQPFTDFEQQDTQGQTHRVSEYVGKGKWVLVDFWASWCGPCRAEVPNVVAAYEKFHDKGFDVVGVSFDDNKEKWLKAIDDLKLPWMQLSDLKGWKNAAAGIYGINAIPASLLVDPQGKIAACDLRGKKLEQKLEEIFAGK